CKSIFAGSADAGDGQFTHLQQGSAERGVRKQHDFFGGCCSVAFGQVAGVFQSATALNNANDFLQVFGAAVEDGLTNQFLVLFFSMLERMNQRQGRFAFGQIVTDVFAQVFDIAVIVQSIIDQLERKANIAAHLFKGLLYAFVRAGNHGAAVRSSFKQDGSFVTDDAHVFSFGNVDAVLVQQLQYFTLGNHVGGICNDLHDADMAKADQNLECPGIDEVAYQYA